VVELVQASRGEAAAAVQSRGSTLRRDLRWSGFENGDTS
jgi:hypothetical protein